MVGHEKIYFTLYKPILRLLDETEQFTSLTGIAHGASTAITAGILGGVGGMAMGWRHWPWSSNRTQKRLAYA